MKKFGFFSLGEIFIANGMGKWGGEINSNTFGNMTHPNDTSAGCHFLCPSSTPHSDAYRRDH